jgi:hypothetical protein
MIASNSPRWRIFRVPRRHDRTCRPEASRLIDHRSGSIDDDIASYRLRSAANNASAAAVAAARCDGFNMSFSLVKKPMLSPAVRSQAPHLVASVGPNEPRDASASTWPEALDIVVAGALDDDISVASG